MNNKLNAELALKSLDAQANKGVLGDLKGLEKKSTGGLGALSALSALSELNKSKAGLAELQRLGDRSEEVEIKISISGGRVNVI